MALAHIIYPPPTPNGLNEWSLQHLAHHQAILYGLQVQKKLIYPLYQIYPINQSDLSDWLEQHANQHDDMNFALGIDGNDLTDVDFNDKKQLDSWMFLHGQEHRSAAEALGLGI